MFVGGVVSIVVFVRVGGVDEGGGSGYGGIESLAWGNWV